MNPKITLDEAETMNFYFSEDLTKQEATSDSEDYDSGSEDEEDEEHLDRTAVSNQAPVLIGSKRKVEDTEFDDVDPVTFAKAKAIITKLTKTEQRDLLRRVWPVGGQTLVLSRLLPDSEAEALVRLRTVMSDVSHLRNTAADFYEILQNNESYLKDPLREDLEKYVNCFKTCINNIMKNI